MTTPRRALPVLAIVCLAFEGAALLLLTLALTSPAPLDSGSLALLVVRPGSALPANGTAASSSLNTSTVVVTSMPNTTAGSILTAYPSMEPIPPPANTATATTTTAALASRAEPIAATAVMQHERLPSPVPSASSVVNTTIAASKLLLRLGPLGSCFRTEENVRTCTPARLTSHYDYTRLQAAGMTTDGLPEGMSSYPLLLLLVIVALLIKTVAGIAVIAAPTRLVPASASSVTSAWQVGANWVVCGVAILVCIATGVKRSSLSGSADSFNTANAANKSIGGGIPLVAETGTSFGIIWISAGLLFTAFFVKRVGIKKQTAIERARGQFEIENAARNEFLDKRQKTIISGEYPTYQTGTTPPKRASAALALLRSFLPTTTHGPTAEAPSLPSVTPAMALDDFYPHSQTRPPPRTAPPLSHFGYLGDTRIHAKESPPFHAYQRSFDEAVRAKDSSAYGDEERQRMASPAPSYWTSSERAHDTQSRRERERQYMAELRRQRSTMK